MIYHGRQWFAMCCILNSLPIIFIHDRSLPIIVIHDSIFVAFLLQCQSWSIMVGNHWQKTVLLGKRYFPWSIVFNYYTPRLLPLHVHHIHFGQYSYPMGSGRPPVAAGKLYISCIGNVAHPCISVIFLGLNELKIKPWQLLTSGMCLYVKWGYNTVLTEGWGSSVLSAHDFWTCIDPLL